MKKRQQNDRIVTPDVRVRYCDLENTIKFADKETGEVKDTGKYGLTVFFPSCDRANFANLENMVTLVTNNQYGPKWPANLMRAFSEVGPEAEYFANTIWFKSKTKYIDNVVLLDAATGEKVSASKFYPGCWVRLVVSPFILASTRFPVNQQQLTLLGVAFVRDDERFVTAFSEDTIREDFGLPAPIPPSPVKW